MFHIAPNKRLMKQITDSILMVRPVQFRMNEETAVNNYYQDQQFHKEIKDADANKRAQGEFDAFAKALQDNNINVIIVNDDEKHDTPDSVFPNNWLSTHENGTAVLYPMFAPNRRLERRPEVLDALEKHGFMIENVMDYTSAEDQEVFLEGTGSLLLDRANETAFVNDTFSITNGLKAAI